MQSLFTTPPHIITLRFGVMLVAQYQGKKVRLALGQKQGFNVEAEEAFLEARAWQYKEALEAIKKAPDETLAQAISGIKMGRAVLKSLRAAGLSDRMARAGRLLSS